jgi:hypothetical protein
MSELEDKKNEILQRETVAVPKTETVVITLPQQTKKKLMDFEY